MGNIHIMRKESKTDVWFLLLARRLRDGNLFFCYYGSKNDREALDVIHRGLFSSNKCKEQLLF